MLCRERVARGVGCCWTYVLLLLWRCGGVGERRYVVAVISKPATGGENVHPKLALLPRESCWSYNK